MTSLDQSKTNGKKKPGRTAWGLFMGFLIVYAGIFGWFGARLIYQANLDPVRLGQQDYLDAVYRSKLQKKGASPDSAENGSGALSVMARSLPNFVDGRIDPLWPWLMAFTGDSGPDTLFLKGKWLNVITCGVALILLGLITAKSFSFVSAGAILLVGGLGFLLDRAVLFRPDLFLFLLTLMTWVCILTLIRQEALWKYGVLGFLLGVLFLTNAFIWPMILSLVFVSLLRALVSRKTSEDVGRPVSSGNTPNQIVGLAVAATSFMVVAGPRLSFANEKFGSAFHRYDQFTMWMDAPEQENRFVRNYPGKSELTSLSGENRPGLMKFLRQKGGWALITRCVKGAEIQFRMIFPGTAFTEISHTMLYWDAGWWLLYFGVVFGVVAVIHKRAAIRKRDQVWRVGGTSAGWVLLFAALTVLMTLAWMGIGQISNRDNTVTPSLFLPIMITLIWLSERFRRQLQRTRDAQMVNRIYLWAMLFPILFVVIRITLAIA